jgi:hypothetical protein
MMSVIFNPLLRNYIDAEVLDLFTGLPMIAVSMLIPIGLMCSLMSYKNQEGNSKVRFTYLIRHIFSCLFLLVIMTTMMTDISKIFE